MVDTPQSLTADLIKQQLEEGKKHAAKEDEGRGPLYDKDRKFLGLIPAPTQAMRGIYYGTWLAFAELASEWMQSKFENVIAPVAKKIGGNSARTNRLIKAGAVAATVGVAASPFILDIFSGSKTEKNKRDLMARKTRALLEEVTGKSGVSAMMGANENQNEVLFVQRKRFEADMQQRLKDDIMSMSLSSAPTAVSTVLRNNPKVFEGILSSTAHEASKAVKDSKKGMVGMSTIASGFAPQLAEVFSEEGRRQYNLNRQKYSALEMIVNLDEQLRDVDFSGDNFTDNFTLPEKAGSKSLAGYIAEVFKQHQRDMENINAEHSPLRSALDSQLEEISQDIAEAIKRGDIAPLALARLAGEGAVIKNRGRSLAKPSEVRTTLQKMSSSALNYLQVESADYYGESSFSRKDLKTALDSLDGDERIIFAALVPDDILKDAGVSQADIQKIRDTSAKVYEQKLAHIVTGLAGYDDQKLGDLGLAKEEIEQLRKVADAVKGKGEESIHEFRAKPTDPAGIERVVTNAVVNRVQGSKEYLGSLMQKGQELMQAAPQAEEASAADVAAEASTRISSDAHEIADEANKVDSAEKTEEKGTFAAKEEARRDAAEEAEEAVQMAV